MSETRLWRRDNRIITVKLEFRPWLACSQPGKRADKITKDLPHARCPGHRPLSAGQRVMPTVGGGWWHPGVLLWGSLWYLTSAEHHQPGGRVGIPPHLCLPTLPGWGWERSEMPWGQRQSQYPTVLWRHRPGRRWEARAEKDGCGHGV